MLNIADIATSTYLKTVKLRNIAMKSIKKIVAISTLTLASFAASAQSVTACAATIDEAESIVAAQAKQAGASYKITEAHFNNGVHMTAKLLPKQ